VQALVSKLKQCIAKVQLTNLKSQKCNASSISEFEISKTTSFYNTILVACKETLP
jgi:hypothetical protein